MTKSWLGLFAVCLGNNKHEKIQASVLREYRDSLFPSALVSRRSQLHL
jgi:hypothetical protein